MILSWICKSLFASELETSGSVTGINNNEPSSSGGMNSEPSLVSITIPVINAITFTARMVLRHLKHQSRIGVYIFSNVLVIGFAFSGFNLPFNMKEISTGVSVIARNASTSNMNVFVQANG